MKFGMMIRSDPLDPIDR